jgi:hypothetical protein
MVIADHAGLPPTGLAAIAAALGEQRTLQEVVRWGFTQRPPLLVVDVIVQDEFTHDVVLPYREGVHLVYDTT